MDETNTVAGDQAVVRTRSWCTTGRIRLHGSAWHNTVQHATDAENVIAWGSEGTSIAAVKPQRPRAQISPRRARTRRVTATSRRRRPYSSVSRLPTLRSVRTLILLAGTSLMRTATVTCYVDGGLHVWTESNTLTQGGWMITRIFPLTGIGVRAHLPDSEWLDSAGIDLGLSVTGMLIGNMAFEPLGDTGGPNMTEGMFTERTSVTSMHGVRSIDFLAAYAANGATDVRIAGVGFCSAPVHTATVSSPDHGRMCELHVRSPEDYRLSRGDQRPAMAAKSQMMW